MLFLGLFALVTVSAAELPPPPYSSSGAAEYGGHGPGQFGFQPRYGQQHGNPQQESLFEKAEKALERLGKETRQLFRDLRSYKTIREVNEENIALLHIIKAQRIDQVNVQQNTLIQMALEEINALLCEVDAAEESAASSLALALQSANVTSDQTEDAQELAELNAQQDATIASINITDIQNQLLVTLQNVISDLEVAVNSTSAEAAALEAFVRSRRCEYGNAQLSLQGTNDSREVDFLTQFDVPPSVLVTGYSFAAEIEEEEYGHGYGKDGFDVLAWAFAASDITTSGFKVVVSESSSGRVKNKRASVIWVACQNLNDRLLTVRGRKDNKKTLVFHK